MKKSAAFLLLTFSLVFSSCKKYVQQQEQDAAISLITNGTWMVQQYLQSGSNITASFSGYVFQFKSDGTVVGTLGGTSVTGTWAADINNRTITSNFPAGSGILDDLDGVWKITDSSVSYVVANTSVGTGVNNLRLQKN
jgi:hypothetical protein